MKRVKAKSLGTLITETVYSEERLAQALQTLVDMYVANQGTPSEFVQCITLAPGMYKTQRKENRVWKAWDEARAALKARPQHHD